MKSFLFIGFVTIFMSSNLYAERYLKIKNCSKEQMIQISKAVIDNPKDIENLVLELDRYVNRNRDLLTESDLSQFGKAREILACTHGKVQRVNRYKCVESDEHAAYVQKITFGGSFGINIPGVNLTNFFFDESAQAQIDIVRHEISHKCGALDGETYFVQHHQSPYQTISRNDDWGKLAPIYDYWKVHGVCLPSVEC